MNTMVKLSCPLHARQLISKESHMSRRKREMNIMGNTAWLADVLRNVHNVDVVARLIAERFSAESVVIWVRDRLTIGRFYPLGVYGRDDLTRNKSYNFITPGNNVISFNTKSDDNIVEGKIGEPPFSGPWLEKEYTRSLVEYGYGYIFVCPINCADGHPYCVISLYYYGSKRPQLSRSILKETGRFVYTMLSNVRDAVEQDNIEKRALGHEISAQLRIMESSIKLIKRSHEIATTYASQWTDIDKAINLTRKYTKMGKISEVIEDRALKKMPHNFRDSYNSVVQPLIREHSVSRVQLYPLQTESNIFIVMSEDDLRHIITNLITNAMKYSVPGGVISSKLRRLDNGGVLFVMSNPSAGISDAESSQIWNDGFRGLNADTSCVEGEGLGLAIVRRICDIYKLKYHHREIPPTSISKLNWSEFYIEFPPEMVK